MGEMKIFLKKIYQIQKGKIGKVIVKYLDPIDFNQYIEGATPSYPDVPKGNTHYQVSLQMTRDLKYI